MFPALALQDLRVPRVGVAPAQVLVQSPGLHEMVRVVRIGHGELLQHPEMRQLDRVRPRGVGGREAQLDAMPGGPVADPRVAAGRLPVNPGSRQSSPMSRLNRRLISRTVSSSAATRRAITGTVLPPAEASKIVARRQGTTLLPCFDSPRRTIRCSHCPSARESAGALSHVQQCLQRGTMPHTVNHCGHRTSGVRSCSNIVTNPLPPHATTSGLEYAF